jgi:hypothetical protein
MTRTNVDPRRAIGADLRQVIEPLASYICASDRPRRALSLVFAALSDEVAQVNRTARSHVLRLLEPAAR